MSTVAQRHCVPCKSGGLHENDFIMAGKHVLCEKPIGLNVAEAKKLLVAAGQHPDLKVMEAFMYRHHPQWRKTRERVVQGDIGELKTIQSFFSYDKRDPDNIRNQADIGGGGLMDIGCYCISLARFLFEAEPHRVFGHIEYDPQFKIDRHTKPRGRPSRFTPIDTYGYALCTRQQMAG